MLIAIVAIVVLTACSFLDGWRDAAHGARYSWWKWHLIKWGAFYPPLAFIWWVHVPGIVLKALVVVAAMALWPLGARAGGKDWGGFWTGRRYD